MFGPENTGNGRYTMNLVEELAKTDNGNDYVILLRKNYFDSLKLPKNWTKVLADFRHYTFTEQFKLPFLIYKHKPDLVHFPHLNVPILYFGKYVVTIHDIIMHKFTGGSATTRPFPIYQIWRLGYHISFLKAVYGSIKIIVPSNAVKDELSDYYKLRNNKIKVVYEGFDGKITKGGDNKHAKPYFLYVGNAYPHKNLENLVKAVVLLNKESVQRANLLISSSRNIFTQRLNDLITSLNAQKYVKLLGFVPDSELGSLYKNAVGFTFASRSEGFGLTGLEAISSGTLLLASAIPVLEEVFEDNAIYFDPLDAPSIASAMQKTLEMNPEERKKRITTAQEFAKRYSWAKMAKQTLEIYETESRNSLRSGK
jgi:glycosyltransferase involved in cell wall biosynthesis